MNSRFKYEKGLLINKVDLNPRARKGNVAGTLRKDGYRAVRINGKSKLVHRLIWEMFNGPIPEGMQIDHIDRDPRNNRIENLRLVTNQENAFNTDAKGAYFDKRRGNWYAQIRKNKKVKCLGTYKTEKEAKEAYANAKKQYHRIRSSNNGS